MIKPSYETVNANSDYSFLVRKFNQFKFTSPYHFHPEYELTFIVKGGGSRYVGNHMGTYGKGDLVLLGSNLPHCWKTENASNNEINAVSVVIQFNEDFLGPDFFSKPELSLIAGLLERSAQGIKFSNKTSKEVERNFFLLEREENNFKRLILFMEILHSLAGCKDYILLNQKHIFATQPAIQRERINAVLSYIVDNFQNEISLQKAAALAHMTPNAFCKYYRKSTGQTFINTVIDYRISYAVQQVIHSDKSMAEISFESGFGDISHFNKLFKRKTKMSPLHYRKTYHLASSNMEKSIFSSPAHLIKSENILEPDLG